MFQKVMIWDVILCNGPSIKQITDRVGGDDWQYLHLNSAKDIRKARDAKFLHDFLGHMLYARRSRQANAQGFDLWGLLKHRPPLTCFETPHRSLLLFYQSAEANQKGTTSESFKIFWPPFQSTEPAKQLQLRHEIKKRGFFSVNVM